MTFYLLTTGFSANTLERAALLQAACHQRGIANVAIESTTASRRALPKLQAGDALYNATRGGRRLEEALWQPRVSTFYAGPLLPHAVQDTTRWIAGHTRAELAQPRTIAHATADRVLLAEYVDHLGGFPVVVKVGGGTLGVGVMRADSWPALLSLTDYLVSTGTDFILREYLVSTSCARLIVIGDRVVVALEDENPPNDFRSNAATQRKRRRIEVSAAVEAEAVKAVHSAGVEFGGVDFLFDAAGQPFLLEVNFPCGLAAFQEYDVDVPGMMVEYLAAKAAQLQKQLF